MYKRALHTSMASRLSKQALEQAFQLVKAGIDYNGRKRREEVIII